jgi:pyruvate/2-oxoglutarate dehydrogenase complex dihydrolipoamide acyltransferase (E2) component
MDEPTAVLIPQDNVNDETVTLLDWCVANGTAVEAGQALAKVEGGKSVFTIYAPVGGVVAYSLAPGREVEVGRTLCTIRGENVPLDHSRGSTNEAWKDNEEVASAPGPDVLLKTEKIATAPDHSHATATPFSPSPAQPRFSQKAAALAHKHGIDPKVFAGQGLVTSSRVVAAMHNQKAPGVSTTPKGVVPPQERPKPIPAHGVPTRVERLAPSKRTEVRYLASSYQNTLASAVTVAVPTGGLKTAATNSSFSGGSVAIVVFEVARLLARYPAFNAYYSDGCMHLYEEINIGVAFDAGQGLKVPVIRRADHKGLKDIADEIQTLLLHYLENRLSLESMAGGTFTITDLSNEGVSSFHPLINQGQAAILGVGAEFFPPGSREGFFNLILSFDHQLAEGRSAAGFLRDLAQRLQAYEAALQFKPDNRNGQEEWHCARCLTPLSRLQRLDPHRSGDLFLVQVVQPSGKTEYRCSICIQGW